MIMSLPQRAIRALRIWALAAHIISGLLSAASIILLTAVSARCPDFKAHLYSSEPYAFMVALYVFPWIAAAALQKVFLYRTSWSLDIWRVLTVLAIYWNARINVPFLEDYGARATAASPGCPMSAMSYIAMHFDLYQHEDLSHALPPLFLLAALVAAFIIGGSLRAGSFLMMHFFKRDRPKNVE